MKRMLERLGFDKRTMMRFLLVILNSQLIYAFMIRFWRLWA